MSYEKRSVAELRSFCTARKIVVPGQGKSRTTALVALLEDEDEIGTTFGRFLDLPPELRLLVYEYYIDDVKHGFGIRRDDGTYRAHKIPTPPPISQTCALVRRETIPLFSKTFQLEIGLAHEISSQPREQERLFCMYGCYVKIFTKAPSHLLAMVRKLMITGYINWQGSLLSARCTIDLPTGQQPLQVSTEVKLHSGRGPQPPDQLLEGVDSAFKKEVHKFLEDMTAKSNGMVLEHGDQLEIPKIWDRTVQSLSALPN